MPPVNSLGSAKRLILVLVLAIAIICIITISPFRTQNDKVDRGKESDSNKDLKPIFETYLQKRYPDTFKVEQVYYGPQTGEYSCYAYPIKNKDMEFYVIAKMNHNNKYVLHDNYLNILWEKEINEELATSISSTFLPNKVSYYIEILGTPVFSEGKITYVFKFSDYIPKSKLPTYDEVKRNPYINEIYKKIELNINTQGNQIDIKNEYEKMLKVIQFVRQEEYNPTFLTISYGSIVRTDNVSMFKTDPDNDFTFNTKDINSINSVDDLKKKIIR